LLLGPNRNAVAALRDVEPHAYRPPSWNPDAWGCPVPGRPNPIENEHVRRRVSHCGPGLAWPSRRPLNEGRSRFAEDWRSRGRSLPFRVEGPSIRILVPARSGRGRPGIIFALPTTRHAPVPPQQGGFFCVGGARWAEGNCFLPPAFCLVRSCVTARCPSDGRAAISAVAIPVRIEETPQIWSMQGHSVRAAASCLDQPTVHPGRPAGGFHRRMAAGRHRPCSNPNRALALLFSPVPL